MFDSRPIEASILARFDTGLTWPEIHALFVDAGRRAARNFVGDAEDRGHLRWLMPPRGARGVLRGRGRWVLTDAGRSFVQASAEGEA